MSRLEFFDPLSIGTRASVRRAFSDGRVTRLADEPEAVGYLVKGDQFIDDAAGAPVQDAFGVSALFDEDTGTLISAALHVCPNPSSDVVQRFNRLLKGLGVDLFWYHRAGRVQFHTPGAWHDVPVEVHYDHRTSTTSWRTPGGDWTTVGAHASRPKATRVAGTVVARSRTITVPPSTMSAAAGEAIARAAIEAATAPEPTPAPEPVKVTPKTRMVDERGLFKFPVVTKASEVIVKADISSGLSRLWDLHVNGHRQVLAMVGPTGTGKTSLAYNLAAKHDVGIMTFDAAGAREFSDWVGTTHLRDGKTEFLPSGFLTAIDADGPYGGQPRIVLIDEVNRAESSGALNALIPVLHGFGTLYVPELGHGVNIDPTVMVIMTANRGSQYAGTVGLDLALSDRVTSWVKMDYIEASIESTLIVTRTGVDKARADRLVLAASQVRQAAERGELPEGGGISTRRLMLAAEKVAGGFTLHEAASWTWIGSYSDEGGSSSEASVVRAAIDGTLRGF